MSLRRIPVRTPTLPPATHTNCYVVGRDELWVVDPASPYKDEQARLAEQLQRLPGRVTGILLTHQHADHVGGANDLRQRLGVPVFAHDETARALHGQVRVDQLVDEGVQHEDWELLLTPGHTRGHLCLHHPSGDLIAGDMVASEGTIVLEAPDGSLQHYLDSLHRLRDLDAQRLLPSHGGPIANAHGHLSHYIQHRNARSEQILAALQERGPGEPAQLVEWVYGDTIPRFVYPLAARQVTCHLHWLRDQGRVELDGERWRAR